MAEVGHPASRGGSNVYGVKELGRLLGLRDSAVRSLVRAGYVRPHRGHRGRLEFSFQDLIVLRTATALRGAKLPARRINSCLRKLRAALPTSMPLSGLSITAVGDQVAVREGRQHWDTQSGQYLLALDVAVEGGEVRVAPYQPKAQKESERKGNTDEDEAAQFEVGFDLESTDVDAAIKAYQRCLAANSSHIEARLNCGRLLHMSGRLADAERLYRAAHSPDASLLFNLAIVLEDLGREPEAIEAYRSALELDPQLADAHFNLARLHERAGNQRELFHHLLAYKRMTT